MKSPKRALSLLRKPFAYLARHGAFLGFSRGLAYLDGFGYGGRSTRREAVELALLCANTSTPTIWDIGANRGDYCAAVLQELPNAKVLCFEPSAFAFEQLAQRFNGDSRVTCHNVAVGGKRGVATLYADKPGSVLGSLTQRNLDYASTAFSHNEVVDVVTIDDLLERDDLQKPTAVKFDIEGSEFDVLKASQQLLTRIDVIQFEFGGPNLDTRTYFHDLWELLDKHAFQLGRVTPFFLKKVTEYHPSLEYFSASNYIAWRMDPAL